MSVWWALRGAVREATSSKRRDLRVLHGRPNPCLTVQPPGDRESRQDRRKTFVYPSEFARLVACTSVPIVWRQTHAIAAYTYLRPSELRALRWPDVDMDHARIRITKAWSYLDSIVKPPKTRNGIRDVPIHPRLLPLLRRMRRTHGELASGVARDTLHFSSAATVRANFRSWRDSGITWLAMAGLDAAKVMRRAGHDDIGTTMRYVKQAEDVGAELGEPFAALPDDLTAAE